MHAEIDWHAEPFENQLQHRHDDDSAADTEQAGQNAGRDTRREHGDGNNDEFRHPGRQPALTGKTVVWRARPASQVRLRSRTPHPQFAFDHGTALLCPANPVSVESDLDRCLDVVR